MKVKEGILVHASKILDPEFQVVNQNKSKVMMPASFLNNQSAGTVPYLFNESCQRVDYKFID